MLEYRPIVHFLEKGGNFTEKDCQNPESNRILKVFLEDFHNTFPNEEPPCLLGLTAAQVMEVEGLVRITEHDGKETVEEVYDDSIL